MAFAAHFVLRGVSRALGPTIPDRAIAHLLEALTRTNVDTMRAALDKGQPVPTLYSTGVRYVPEERRADGQRAENWRDWVEVLRKMTGDCEDLAAYRAAELRLQGRVAGCVFHSRQLARGKRLFHIFVECDGKLEDPSRELGMKG